MRQEINLYRGRSKQPIKPLTVAWMARAGLAFVVSLAIVAAVEFGLNRELEGQVAEAQQTVAKHSAKLQTLRLSHPEPQADPALSQQAERRQALVANLRSVLAQLESDELDARTGFSGYFEGLARHGHAGVWLREVSFTRGGREIRFAGSALRREDLPEWIRSLSQEPSFKAKTFSGFSLAEPAPRRDHVEFTLSTRPLESKSDGRS